MFTEKKLLARQEQIIKKLHSCAVVVEMKLKFS